MSQSIEERVVQMKFENGQFEKGVATSINTMNSLKKSMNFDDAVKGFQKLDESAKAVDMSHLGNAIETVRVKFSFLDRFAIQVMDRISNKIIDVAATAKRMVDNLSVDQVSAGWDKFGQKTSAVQTIMAATASKFSDTATQMATVNEQLDKLNWFTDETSYNFLDMVNNIGKFTSNNIDLKTSVTAMQGISNWAAISGATINEAGRAMYNLSQAVATGSVKLIDWKSIENANMATAEFKKTAIETAAELGTLKKLSDTTFETLDGKVQISTETFQGFNDSLQKAWFSSDVLLKTLDQYGGATNKLHEIYMALDEEVTTSDIVSAIDDYSKALSKARAESEGLGLSSEETARKAEEAGKEVAQEVADEWGITLEQANKWLSEFDSEVMQFGLKSFKAAQEAKTLTDAIEATKDAVSTGWMKSFELVFGNYLEAKELWTAVANQMYDLFAGMTSARNVMLGEWKELGGNQYIVDIIVGLLQSLNNLKMAIAAGLELIFGKMDANRLLNFTKAVHSFVLALTPTEDVMVTVAKATAVLLTPLDILFTLLKGGVNAAIRVFNAVMGDSKLNILGFADSIFDVILDFRTWFHTSTILTDAVDRLIYGITKLRSGVVWLIDTVKNMPLVQTIMQGIRDTLAAASTDIFAYVGRTRAGFSEFISWFKQAPKIETFDDIKKTLEKFYETVLKGRLNLETNFPAMTAAVQNFTNSFISAMTPIGQTVYKFLEAPLTFLKDILFHLISELKDFALGIKAVDIAVVAVAAGVWVALKNVTKILDIFNGIVGKVIGVIKGIGTVFAKWLKAKQVKEYAKAIMYLAIALKMVSDIEPERALMSVGLITLLGAAVLGMAKAMEKVKGGKLSTAMVGILALSVLAIVGALALLSTIDASQLDKDLLIMAGLIAGMGAISVALSKFAPSIQNMSTTILAFSAGILLLISALKKISKMDPHDILTGLVGLISIMTTLAVALRIMNKTLSPGNTSAIAGGGTILAFAVGINLLIGALKSISKLNPAEAMTAILEITALMLGLSAAMRIMTGLGGESGKFKAGSTFLALAIALNLLVPAIKGLAGVQDAELEKAKNVIAQLGLIFVAAIGLSKIGGANSGRVGLMLIEMAAAITILTVAVRAMGGMDESVLVKGVTAVTVLGLMFSAAISASRDAEKAQKALTVMTVALGILTLSVWELGKLPMAQLISSAGSISVLLLSLGGSLKLISGMKVNAKILVSIGIMGVVVAEIGYLIARMTKIGDMTKAIAAAGAIGIVLGSLAVSMRLLSGTKGVDKSVLGNIAVIGAIAAALGLVIVGLVNTFPETDISKAIGIVVALDMLIPMLTGCMLLLDKIKSAPNKTTMKKFMQMSAAFAAIGVVIYGLTAIAPEGDIKKSLGIVAAIDLLLPVMTACMVGLATVRQGPPKTTMEALWGFVAVVGVLGSVIAFLSTIEQANITTAIGLVAAIDLLLPMLTGCIIALNNFGGNTLNKEALLGIAALGGIAEVLLLALIGFTQIADIDFDNLMTVVLALDALLAVLTPCFLAINSVGRISPTVIESAAIAGLAMDAIGTLLTALVWVMGQFPPETLKRGAENGTLIGQAIGGFIGGVLGGIVGGTLTAIIQVIPALGTALSQFITNASGFMDGISGIDASMVGKAGALVGVIIALAAADFVLAVETLASGVLDLLSGLIGANTDFKGKMQEMGEAIAAFANACGDVDAAKVKTAAEAAHLLVDLEASIPRQGGALQSFFGTQDIAAFGSRLSQFGMALRLFVGWVKDISESDVSGAAAAASAMSKVEANLPAYGGKLQEWFGERDLAAFGARLVSFGMSLSTYAENVKDISKASVQGSADAGKILADLEKNLTFSGGFVTKFLFGEQSLGSFGLRLTTFGDALVTYSSKVKDISKASVQGSADAIAILAEMEKSLDVTGGVKGFWFGDSSFSGFADNLTDLGNSLQAYDESISDVNIGKVNTVSGAIQRLIDLAQKITTTGTWATDLVNTIDGIVEYFLTEMKHKESTIREQGENIIKWLVLGFGNGSSKYSKLAETYGVIIANRVRQGVEKTLEIASPSAVMEEDGHWVVKGLAEGIDKDTSAEDAATKKAQNIEAAFKSVFEKLDTLGTKYSTEYELWTLTEGKDASELDKYLKEYEFGVQEYKRLSDEAQKYAALMETYRKTFGDDSQEFLAAQNKYNQAQIDLYTQRDKVDEIAKRQLTLNKPSATMMANGKWLIESLAYGISSDMSAEEALAQQVQNLADAFQPLLDKLDLEKTAADIEYDYWQAAEGYLATDAEKQAKEFEVGIAELNRLARVVQTRNGELEGVRQKFGENSEQFRLQELEVKKAMTDMLNQQNDLQDLMGGIVKKDRNEIARTYAAYRKEAADLAKMMEWTEQDQMDYAARMAGFADDAAYVLAMQTNDFGEPDWAGQIKDAMKPAYEKMEIQIAEDFASTVEEAYKVGMSNVDLSSIAGENGDPFDINWIVGQGLEAQQVEIDNTVEKTAEKVTKRVSKAVKDGVSKGVDESNSDGSLLDKGTTVGKAVTDGIDKALAEGATSIRDKAGNVADSLSDTFKSKLGIASPSKVTYEIGEWAVIGLANGLRDRTYQIRDNAYEAGTQLCVGLQQGIDAMTPSVMMTVQSLASRVASTLRSALGVHSPSRVADEIGRFVGVGFANGIVYNEAMVNSATENLAEGSIDALANARSRIQSILDSDDDMLVLTPVLDMDTLIAQAHSIGGILDKNSGFSIKAANLQVGAIAARKAETERQNGSNTAPKESVTNYNYTQNNYSPKALSQAEIYRKTKNQFSRLKGATQR